MGLSALMAWNGGWLKLYNDIPSLIGYLSVVLLIYKIGIKIVNRFFEWANSFSYELYLVHSLVFVIVAYYLKGIIPLYAEIVMSLIVAYVVGYYYSWFLKKMRLK
jgi:peptidoglycan/LPS O-acetylase OafA/YrhL